MIAGWFKKVGSGVGLVLSGVVFLTLNERRGVAQAKLELMARDSVMSLTETDTESVDASLNGRLLHYCGTLAAEEGAGDFELGVSAQELIKLRRTVEMYQWKEKEHKKTTKTKSGNEQVETTYSYEKVWSESPLKVTHDADKRNPDFPPLRSAVYLANGIWLGRQDHLEPDDSLLDLLTHFRPISLSATTMARREADGAPMPYNLHVSQSGKQLVNGSGYFRDEIGDLRVTYAGIWSGPYTAVAKLAVSEDGHRVLMPYRARLKATLASQGDIRAPSDLNDLLGVELDSFVVPEPVIAKLEEMLLFIAPLEVSHLSPGYQTVRGAFQGISQRSYDTLNSLRVAGFLITFAGSVLALPVTTSATVSAAAVGAAALSYKTIRNATPKQTKTPAADAPDVEI